MGAQPLLHLTYNLVMHAIVHLWDAAAGREHVHALLVEIPLAQNTVAVAHGGTLRGLIVQLGIHSAEEAPHLDIAQGVAYAISGGMLSRYA
jgi:broad specificity phosphatase PhoE